jgi:hypothetical protein
VPLTQWIDPARIVIKRIRDSIQSHAATDG